MAGDRHVNTTLPFGSAEVHKAIERDAECKKAATILLKSGGSFTSVTYPKVSGLGD